MGILESLSEPRVGGGLLDESDESDESDENYESDERGLAQCNQ